MHLADGDGNATGSGAAQHGHPHTDMADGRAAPGRDAMPVCRVRAVHVVARGARLVVAISADRYLLHMVRNIVGSAVLVGKGTHPPRWLGEVLVSNDRRLAGPTAPPHGLFLVRVLYGEDA